MHLVRHDSGFPFKAERYDWLGHSFPLRGLALTHHLTVQQEPHFSLQKFLLPCPVLSSMEGDFVSFVDFCVFGSQDGAWHVEASGIRGE